MDTTPETEPASSAPPPAPPAADPMLGVPAAEPVQERRGLSKKTLIAGAVGVVVIVAAALFGLSLATSKPAVTTTATGAPGAGAARPGGPNARQQRNAH